MTKLGLVIFDCDGVLVNSEPASERVFVEMASPGVDIPLEEVSSRYLGMSDDFAFNDLATRYGLRLPADFFLRLEESKLAAYQLGLNLIPGAIHAVQRVSAKGVPSCVATSGTSSETRAKLAGTPLAAIFASRIYTASMVAQGKPAPDLFLHAAREMGVAPELCVVVEDSAAGVRGATEAGMRVLGYAPKGDVLGLSDLGAEVFPSMADVPSLLGI